ncbi:MULTISPECIES: CDP-diacylglycerol--glycerol-3-phosphate 3-phosphatidyltransferase [Commensalibacter]|uniref:CDP-diacylglycerol--glycerol-3-phosphate 3-phosphatidyltransferase n=1 Tax=Commensalibacter melissae TaxID=2070537 RepID=A0A318ND99_9PROT|nr:MULTISPECIES: CDP-diacylglycerol--glycerol-3-phosphate 3-phosphatidyltransferase [Commensalibacter]AYN86885.1 CDP-diacylglycerol--glycerol-3-phosphate 3-phosphatidyltransferase [Commensalibacter melissae]MBH9969594.1 CDP-diacylglycerol--glycerol-3-phosphate 3-phosphatidyltransferase [Commensalibacter sp. M0265]MBH9972837.1 CDP-diacylglycerol--glycerol-3-phosphate 3-phosphatidyltransferase [Commensalibacter melissae]MBH9976949.1 CDP-diacylglycerol--glycerol-3-phosphate 3-phosphatidyltransfera
MFYNLPNCLTLSRIIIIPLVAVLVMVHKPVTDLLACILFIIAGITDYLDGKLARAWQQLSDFGKMFDPIADKLLVGIILIVMAGYDRLPYGGLIPAMIILAREILVSGLREYLSSFEISLPVTKLAKWKTTFQMVAIGFLLAGDSSAELLNINWFPVNVIGSILLWIAAILTIITGWGYIHTGIRFINKTDF